MKKPHERGLNFVCNLEISFPVFKNCFQWNILNSIFGSTNPTNNTFYLHGVLIWNLDTKGSCKSAFTIVWCFSGTKFCDRGNGCSGLCYETVSIKEYWEFLIKSREGISCSCCYNRCKIPKSSRGKRNITSILNFWRMRKSIITNTTRIIVVCKPTIFCIRWQLYPIWISNILSNFNSFSCYIDSINPKFRFYGIVLTTSYGVPCSRESYSYNNNNRQYFNDGHS